MDKIIKQGTRVYLRTPKREEVGFIRTLWESEENKRGFDDAHTFSEDEYQSWYVDKIEPGNDNDCFLIIFENENDIPIGEVGFVDLTPETKTAQLDITVKSKYRRRGFGREALMLLCDLFFIDYDGEKIEATVKKENNAGSNMLANFGFSVQDKTDAASTYTLKKSDYLPE
ncbi:MAG: GNAT family N-acetyltransferase [Spirochaetales bacterium]|nr:GNAT family N-acetyltransferase [Spirochaetales bacterium]